MHESDEITGGSLASLVGEVSSLLIRLRRFESDETGGEMGSDGRWTSFGSQIERGANVDFNELLLSLC
ncbi:MAG: hypothetical protein IPP46_20370 [Bacteroidetes bacterium]|nr:hypothetical protein [Bacteroidota bacterium]